MSDDKRQVTGFKLKPEVRAKLEELAKISDRSMTQVATAAINALYDAHARDRKYIEERAVRGMALLRRIEDRLGEGFWKSEGEEVGFELTQQGRVFVHVGELRYYEEDGGQLLATRVRGGSADFAPIAEDGSMDNWFSTPLAEPAMN
jgi:hypothetical protein